MTTSLTAPGSGRSARRRRRTPSVLGGSQNRLDRPVPLQGPFGAHWEHISAGTVLVIVPTLAVFLFLQRYIHNGFARSATK